MSDLFTDPGDSAPFSRFTAIVVATPFPRCRSIYVGTGGTITVVDPGGGPNVAFTNVPNGSILPIETTLVVSVVSAANLIALY